MSNNEYTSNEPIIERPLGATEDMYWRFDSVSPLNFGTIVKLRGEIEKSELKLALKAIQLRHPLLRVKVDSRIGKKPWFRSGVPAIPLSIIKRDTGSEWSILEDEVSTPFATEVGPLMRSILIQHPEDSTEEYNYTLISTYHHAICDGKSAIYLTRDLLQSLAQQRRGENPYLEPLPPVGYYGDRIPALSSYTDLDGLRTMWKTVLGALHFLSTAGIPTGLRKRRNKPLKQQRLIIEPRFIDPATMKRLIHKAKLERTSIQCVLNAALSLVVAEESPTQAIEATGCTQVLNIRDRLVPPVGEDCGCFVSGATSLHHITRDTQFWPLTRKIHARLQDSLVTPLPFFHPALHQSFARLGRGLGFSGMRMFSDIMNKLHPEGLTVSNLGRVEIEVPDSPVKVVEFAFATNTNVLNYFNTSATTVNGKMTWSFSGSSLLGRERIAAIADRTIERVKQALDEN